MPEAGPARSVLTCSNWYQTFPSPARSSSIDGQAHILINRFVDIPPEIVQPALKDNVIAIHLGGPKRVHRWHGGRRSVQDVELGSLTIMPARQENCWLTEGPIDFAHLTLSTGYLHQLAAEEFDVEPAACELIDRVGVRDPVIEQLFNALLRELEGGRLEGRLYSESLLVVLGVALLRQHSALSKRPCSGEGQSRRGFRKGGLAGWQLRRVVDHMAEFMTVDIALDDLVKLTGLSRAQFFRAFKQSTGLSPHRFLVQMRLDQARVLLETSDLSVDAVALATGFAKARCFAVAFRQYVGVHPRLYRTSRA
jgi:AraC family transcriptional regulator